MRKFLLLSAVFFALASCKTYHMKEHQLFVTGKYAAADTLKMKPTPEWKQTPREAYVSVTDKSRAVVYEDAEIVVKRVFHEADKATDLELFYFIPRKEIRKTGVFFPGNGTKVYDYYVALKHLAVQSGSRIIYVNYRGYGNSKGQPAFETVMADNNRLLKQLRATQHGIDFVCGYSIGTIFATYAAVDNAVPHLFLLSPLSDSYDYAEFLKRSYTPGLKAVFRPFLRLEAPESLMNISPKRKIAGYKGALYIYHSREDRTVPYSMGCAVYECAGTSQKKLQTFETGNHASYFDPLPWQTVIKEVNNITR